MREQTSVVLVAVSLEEEWTHSNACAVVHIGTYTAPLALPCTEKQKEIRRGETTKAIERKNKQSNRKEK